MDGAAKPRNIDEEARRQHSRLSLDHARIRLECASISKGKTIAALYAPSFEAHQELLRAAITEAGLVAKFFDADQFSSVDALIESLPNVHGVVILSDDAFNKSFLSEPQIIWTAEKRPDLRPMVVRVGDSSESKRLQFFLGGGDAIKILDGESWRLVPDFLMEAVARRYR